MCLWMQQKVLQTEKFFGGAVEYFLSLFSSEGEFIEALHFFVGRPHGVISGVHDAVGAKSADDLHCAFGRDGEEGGAGVHIYIFIVDKRGHCGAFPFAVAAEMGADSYELGEQLHYVVHAVGTGVIVAVIAGMDKQGKPAGDRFDHFENMGCVDLEALNVGMDLYALEAGCDYIIHYLRNIFHIGMHGGEGDNAVGIFCVGLQNKVVYAADLRGGGGYGMGHETLYAGAVHFTQRSGELAVEGHGYIVESAHGAGGLFCYFVRENMHMKIYDVHLNHLCMYFLIEFYHGGQAVSFLILLFLTTKEPPAGDMPVVRRGIKKAVRLFYGIDACICRR